MSIRKIILFLVELDCNHGYVVELLWVPTWSLCVCEVVRSDHVTSSEVTSNYCNPLGIASFHTKRVCVWVCESVCFAGQR